MPIHIRLDPATIPRDLAGRVRRIKLQLALSRQL
jgi:hypothetical protein